MYTLKHFYRKAESRPTACPVPTSVGRQTAVTDPDKALTMRDMLIVLHSQHRGPYDLRFLGISSRRPVLTVSDLLTLTFVSAIVCYSE